MRNYLDLFESEDTDHKARIEANEAFDKLIDWVAKTIDYFDDVATSTAQLGGSYVFHARKPGFGRIGDDLLIILSPQQGRKDIKGAFGHAGSRPLIMLSILLEPNSTRFLDTRIRGCRSTFVHEYIHYLAWSTQQTNPKRPPEPGTPGYYNHDEELNAYYQEGVDGFHRLVTNVINMGHYDTAMEMWGSKSTPELVNKIMTGDMQADFVASLTPANRQRIEKRVARFIEQTIRPIFAKGPQERIEN
jgi:hypothetical protein